MASPKMQLGTEMSLIVFFITLHIVGIPGQGIFIEHSIGEGIGEYGVSPAMMDMEPPPPNFNEGVFTTTRRQSFPGGGGMMVRRTISRSMQPFQSTFFQGGNDLLRQLFQSPMPGASNMRWSARKEPNGVNYWNVQRGSRVVQSQRQTYPQRQSQPSQRQSQPSQRQSQPSQRQSQPSQRQSQPSQIQTQPLRLASNFGKQNFINRVSKGRTPRVYPQRKNVINPLPPSGPSIGSGTQFGLNGHQIQKILNMHNGARKELLASDMQEMRWDSRLAGESQAWAQKCVFQHQQNGRGENLAMVYGSYANTDTLLNTGLDGWYQEKQMWNFGDGFSSATGHYTQMIWSSTKYVGCAAQTCPDMLYLVCFYSPAGNVMGSNPYTPGRTCSRCQRCNSGLCS